MASSSRKSSGKTYPLIIQSSSGNALLVGSNDDGEDQVVVDQLLLEILKSDRADAITRNENLPSIMVRLASQRKTLGMRWKEAALFLQAAIDNLRD